MAYLVSRKYQFSLPLYRLEALFEQHGISIPRSSMSRWVISVAELATPILNLMKDDLLSQKVIGCDETILQVLSEAARAPEARSYMWVTVGLCEFPVRLFQYEPGRGEKSARKILEGYNGTIVCDGLKTYSALARKTLGLQLAGCYSHVRRKFFQADKALKKAAPKKTPKTKTPLDLIDKLFEIEREFKDKPPEQRHQARQSKSKEIVKQLEEYCEKYQYKVLPKSLLGKAIAYTLGEWENLTTFLTNPLVPISNNLTEGAIRPFVIGRKNWLFAQTPSGAHASAALYSLVETAKACGIQPYHYLHHLFKELPKARSLEDYEKLLPYKLPEDVTLPPYSPKG
jgi:hypothetical protein